MGKYAAIARDAVLMALGGYTPGQMEDVVRRANTLGNLAMQGKYNIRPAIQVMANVRIVRKLGERFGLVRRELRVHKVALGTGGTREGKTRIPPYQVVDETCKEYLLAENPGLARGAQLHMQ